MTGPEDPNLGHATVRVPIFGVSFAGMVLIALGTVFASLFVFLGGVLLLCIGFGFLLAEPEPERLPVPEPQVRSGPSSLPRGIPIATAPSKGPPRV